MRKTSHDGVDVTSITSGLDNEVKKGGTGIIRFKKNSIKRKVTNFSHESDDGIIEPLLQMDKEKGDSLTRSAKYLLAKGKTDTITENDDSIKVQEKNIVTISASSPTTTSNKVFTSNGNTDSSIYTGSAIEVGPIHNHMNTNIFQGSEVTKSMGATKSPILVELDTSKTSPYSPSLIFTTAKIHTDCKTKLMEPVQITPVPILSTIEGNGLKASSLTDADFKRNEINNENNGTSKAVSEKCNKSNLQLNTDPRPPYLLSKSNSPVTKDALNLKEPTNINEKKLHNVTKQTGVNNIITDNNRISLNPIKCDSKLDNITSNLPSTSFSCVKQSTEGKSRNDNFPKINSTLNKVDLVKNEQSTINDQCNIVKDNFPVSTPNTQKNQSVYEKPDKKIAIQGSKKLQRQKKATIEEPIDNNLGDKNDKLSSDVKRTDVITFSPQPKLIAQSAGISTSPINLVTSSSIVVVTSSTDSKNIACSIPNSKISSKITSEAKSQTKSNGGICEEPSMKTYIASPMQSTPQSINIKRITGQPEKESFITTHQSTIGLKSEAKEKSVSVAKTLPSYIVSTSKTKIGTPITSADAIVSKSEVAKCATSTKSITDTNYLVKTTPSSDFKSTTTPTPSKLVTKQSTSVKPIKTIPDKQNEDNKA